MESTTKAFSKSLLSFVTLACLADQRAATSLPTAGPRSSSPPLVPMSENMRAAAIATFTMMLYSINDACIKLVMEVVPLPQTIACRNVLTVFGTAVLSGQSAFTELRAVSARDLRVLGLRTICEIVLTTTFLFSLRHLPMANAAAVVQVVPLMIVIGGALVFGERVEPADWLISIAGFGGALIIIRPGLDGFNAYALLLVVAALVAAARDLLSRMVSKAVSPTVVALVAATGVLLYSLGWIFVSATQNPDAAAVVPLGTREVLLLVATASLLLSANVLAVVMMRTGAVGFAAPFRYTLLLWASVIQLVAFGSWPDGPTCVGGSVIVGAGLAALQRESQRRASSADLSDALLDEERPAKA